MTTVWGAPRRAYELARNQAAGDRRAQDEVWRKLTSREQGEVVIALGAQARCAARAARTDHGVPIAIPAGIWDRMTCAEIRTFAINAWDGVRSARVPQDPCERCLRTAAEILVELHLAALAAVGMPRSMMAEVCARAAADAR